MSDDMPVVPAHRAKDRAGKITLRTAHEISHALAECGVPDDGVVVVRTDGPHRSIAGLERLIDAVLADEGPADEGEPPLR